MDRISESVNKTPDDFEYEDNEDSGTKIDWSHVSFLIDLIHISS